MKRRMTVGRFNLIDEPWISVMVNEKGQTKLVSLSELLANAHQYKGIAGDMKTQDFAVMRVVLAVLHTVFSRLDANGKAHQVLELDEKLRPMDEITDRQDKKAYERALLNTWLTIWEKGEIPPIVNDYLAKWHDRFFLFDDRYPFYQVTEDVVSEDKITFNKKPYDIKKFNTNGKSINRRISESNNKIALFSPKTSQMRKEILKADEVARWLITFQGYTGLSDKVIFGKEKYSIKNSRGWLYDIGGLYVEGENLFETLILNLVLVHPEETYRYNTQKPVWEYESQEVISKYLALHRPKDLADLYTNWSRGIYIDPETNLDEPFQFGIVKLPEIPHQEAYLEPMTLWRYNESGDNKERFTPKKHPFNQSLWRSYGLMSLPDKDEIKQRRPIIVKWYDIITKKINHDRISINAVSMMDDGNATSWVPINEIYDRLTIDDVVVVDTEDDGWVTWVNGAVEKTKYLIDKIFRSYLHEVRAIRQLSSKHEFVNNQISQVYYSVDRPFRTWLSSISATDSKDEKVIEWYSELRRILAAEVDKIIATAGDRDLIGVTEDGKVKNIFTAHNTFINRLNKELPQKEGVR